MGEWLESTGDQEIDIDFDGALTHVVVTNTKYGVSGSGYALWNPEDTYSFDRGYELAYFRANERLSRKLTRRLSR